ncbi:MAG: 3'-5' exonuclease [Candidatus Thermoplasmatota archaeon]|nr:3'-5' exonuclease [Candidatus Thermoplasmatota archaeon]
MESFSGYRVLGFDTETTGLDPRKDRIVQYAFVGVDEDGQKIVIDSLVDPCMAIPPSSTSVHGISNKDVEGCQPFKEQAGVITEIIDGAVIVGHNVKRFDWKFVEMEYFRCGLQPPSPHSIIDTLELAKKFRIPGRHKLGSLCKRYGIILDRAHSADADAAATLVLLWKMLDEYSDLIGDKVEDLLQSNKGSGGFGSDDGDTGDDAIISFGKYSGLSFPKIVSLDPKYSDWLLSKSSPLTEERRLRLKTLFLD